MRFHSTAYTTVKKSPMITIQLNGRNQTIPDASTVDDLFPVLGCDGKRVAVVVNEVIVRPENRSSHSLQAGDQVEILVFAGGG